MNSEQVITIVVACVASSGLFAFIQFLIQRKDKEKETRYVLYSDLKPLKEGMMALLQDRLEASMLKCIEAGNITQFQVKHLSIMLNAYEANDGNGYIHELWERCQELPIIKLDLPKKNKE